jgi:ABC-2 type transport system ATP-binding protein
VQPATLVEQGDGWARLLVDSDIDLAAVVAALQGSTRLVSFTFEPPTLSELFREAVAA